MLFVGVVVVVVNGAACVGVFVGVPVFAGSSVVGVVIAAVAACRVVAGVGIGVGGRVDVRVAVRSHYR